MNRTTTAFKEQNSVHAVNSSMAMLSQWPSQELAKKCKTMRRHKKGDVVFYEDTIPFGVNYVRSGKVKLYQTSADGKEQIVRVYGPDSVIGYEDLICGSNYRATAKALEDAEIYFIDKPTFLDLLDQSPELNRRLLAVTCHQSQHDQDTICRYALKSVRERVAETLLVLKEKYATPVKGMGYKLDINLSRSEIASLAGTVLESAVRTLSEFQDDGLIALKGRDVYILKPDALTKISNGSIL